MNLSTERRWRTCAPLLLALLGGCAATPTPQIFTLDGAPLAPGQRASPSIVLTRVELPEMLDRLQLLVRTGEYRVVVDEHRRWAEPLRRALPRLLAAELGARLDSAAVVASSTEAQTLDPDVRVALDFRRLEMVAGEGARIDLSWRLTPRRGDASVGSRQFTETAPPVAAADTDAERLALVAALRRAVAGVAAELATAIADANFPRR